MQSKLRETVSVFDFMNKDQIADVKSGSPTMDHSAAVQAALDSGGPNGRVFVVAEPGKYQVKDLIIKNPNVSLIGKGECWFLNTEPFTNTSGNPHYPTIWVAANNSTIRNIKFSYPGWIEDNMTSLSTPRNSTDPWYGCHIGVGFTRMWTSANSGIYHKLRGITLSIIKNTVIEGCDIVGSIVHGVAVFNAVNTKVKNNSIRQFKATGIFAYHVSEFEAYENELKNSIDDGMYIGVNPAALTGSGSGTVWTPLTISDMKSIIVSKNRAYQVGAKGLSVQGYRDVLISDNIVDSCYASAISAWTEGYVNAGCSNVQITGNVITDAFGSFGTKADGYFNPLHIVSTVGGTYHAIDISGSSKIVVSNNVVSLTTKTLSQNEFLASRGVGGLGNFQDAKITSNYFKRFLRSTIGRESAATTVTSNVDISYNCFDASGETEVPRLIQIGVNAHSINITNNTLLSGSAGGAGWGAIVCLSGSRVIARGNQFNLPSGVAKFISTGAFLKADENSIDAVSASDITASSISKRIFWLAAAPTAGATWERGDIVYNTTPSASGSVGWVCVGTPASSTGSMSSGSATLTVASSNNFRNGDSITVVGAGAAGANLVTIISSGGGTATLTLAATASTTVTGAVVTTPGTWKTFGTIAA